MHDGDKGEIDLSKSKLLSISVEVEDLDKAIEYYSSNFGIGPFVVQERTNDAILHGKESRHTTRWAMAPMGGGRVVLSLTQIIEGESIHKEILRRRGEGMSSLCFKVEDLDQGIAQFEKKGIGVLQYAKRKTGGGFAYMDTAKVGGVVIELLEGGLSGMPND